MPIDSFEFVKNKLYKSQTEWRYRSDSFDLLSHPKRDLSLVSFAPNEYNSGRFTETTGLLLLIVVVNAIGMASLREDSRLRNVAERSLCSAARELIRCAHESQPQYKCVFFSMNSSVQLRQFDRFLFFYQTNRNRESTSFSTLREKIIIFPKKKKEKTWKIVWIGRDSGYHYVTHSYKRAYDCGTSPFSLINL